MVLLTPFRFVRRLFFRTQEIASLGANKFSKLKLIFFFVLFGFLEKCKVHYPVAPSFFLKKFNICFSVRISTLYEFEALREVFILEEYAISAKNPKVIFDLGSNIGLSVIYFALKYPTARIFAFEPVPHTARLLRENVSKFPTVEVHETAVSDNNGKQELFMSRKSSLASSLVQRSNTESINITTRTLDFLMDSIHVDTIDILKFDIEGAEYRVFKALNKLSHVHYAVGEVHCDLMDATKDDFLNLFENFDVQLRELKINTRYLLSARQKTFL